MLVRTAHGVFVFRVLPLASDWFRGSKPAQSTSHGSSRVHDRYGRFVAFSLSVLSRRLRQRQSHRHVLKCFTSRADLDSKGVSTADCNRM